MVQKQKIIVNGKIEKKKQHNVRKEGSGRIEGLETTGLYVPIVLRLKLYRDNNSLSQHTILCFDLTT